MTRPRTIPGKKLTRDEIRESEELAGVKIPPMPKIREECMGSARPCIRVRCRHHLYLDVNERTGSIKINFPDLDVRELDETCSLDIADRGESTLEEVGTVLSITRERARQLEVRGLVKLQRARHKLR